MQEIDDTMVAELSGTLDVGDTTKIEKESLT